MIRARALVSIGILLAGVVFLPPAPALLAENSNSPAAAAHGSALGQYSVWQAWKLYCVECHIGQKAPAGLNLQALDLGNLASNGAVWEKLLRKLRNREMPPAGMPRPDEATYQALVKYIETERDHAAEVKPDPGRPTLHRLNRAEYANAIRDLLALAIDVAEMLISELQVISPPRTSHP